MNDNEILNQTIKRISSLLTLSFNFTLLYDLHEKFHVLRDSELAIIYCLFIVINHIDNIVFADFYQRTKPCTISMDEEELLHLDTLSKFVSTNDYQGRKDMLIYMMKVCAAKIYNFISIETGKGNFSDTMYLLKADILRYYQPFIFMIAKLESYDESKLRKLKKRIDTLDRHFSDQNKLEESDVYKYIPKLFQELDRN